ncbi:peptidoglycan DD-metalloendopeptidase family protein [Oceanobacillus sp. CAU 1775]
MNEENKFSPKKRWTRIFRKKWFFPSVYLILAALLISAVVWYQTSDDEQIADGNEVLLNSEDYVPVINEEDAEPVMEHQELIQLPVANLDEAQIVTNFFDYNADEAVKANALIHYNKRYYQSTGVDIAREDGESFDVVAALSGTVTEVKFDPLMGNIVRISHDNDVSTYYASLEDVNVSADDKVKQGDVIGTAGKNNFGKENGVHVHFELRKADEILNPEAYVNHPVINLDEPSDEPESDSDADSDTESEPGAEEDDERSDDSEADDAETDADAEDPAEEEDTEE